MAVDGRCPQCTWHWLSSQRCQGRLWPLRGDIPTLPAFIFSRPPPYPGTCPDHPSPPQSATCSRHLPASGTSLGRLLLTSKAGSAFLAGASHTGWDRKGFSLSSPAAAAGVPTPGGPSWVRGEAGLGGGGCGSILGCPGATRVWQLRHRPYGFLRWMNHRWPWPGSVAPLAPARAPAEAGEGVMKSVFRHRPPGTAEVPSAAALALPERSVPPWWVWQAWHSQELPAVAALEGVPGGPHQHWGSHLICWACRVSAPPCLVPGLDPLGSLLAASGLREHLGFLGEKGHQAPAQASAEASAPDCSQHGSGLKPWSCGWGMGCGVPSTSEGMAGTLSPQSHSCARNIRLCWVFMGSQSCFGGVHVGPWLGWWHTVITPWRWPSLGTLVTRCAQSSRWQLVQLGWLGLGQSTAQVASQSWGTALSLLTPLQPQAGDCREREWGVSGGWVTTLSAAVHTSD